MSRPRPFLTRARNRVSRASSAGPSPASPLSEGDARPVVGDAHAAVGGQRDVDGGGTAGQDLVHRPVRDLEDHLVQAALARAADVHPGSLPNGFPPLRSSTWMWPASYMVVSSLTMSPPVVSSSTSKARGFRENARSEPLPRSSWRGGGRPPGGRRPGVRTQAPECGRGLAEGVDGVFPSAPGAPSHVARAPGSAGPYEHRARPTSVRRAGPRDPAPRFLDRSGQPIMPSVGRTGVGRAGTPERT